MSIAIVLSGGGAKGDFQVGALRFIYDQGVRPDILCGTSVGSINAIKLAEGESSADPQQGLAGLEAIWQSLQQESDMYLEEAWLSDPDMDPQVRKVLTGRASDLDVTVPPAEIPEWGDIGWVVAKIQGLAFLVTDGQALLKSLQVIISKARALYNLEPIRAKLTTQLDTSKLTAWASAGRKLRLSVVGLESGRLRWVTETGEVIERDGSPVFDRNTAPVSCRSLANRLQSTDEEIGRLQNDLQRASPIEKSFIASQIREALQQRSQIKAQYDACLQSEPATIPLRLPDIRRGVLASASIPGIFPPVRLGGESYVDGGVREVLPLQMAVDLGAETIYAVSASRPDLVASGSDYADAKLASILARSVMDIMINEITLDDQQIHPRNPGQPLPQVWDIRPGVDLHDITVIDPGLIQINRDYGYMRAADVIGGVDRLSRRWMLPTEIALLRRDIWSLENRRFGREDSTRPSALTPPPDPSLQTSIDQKKGQLRVLIDERHSLGGPMSAGIDRWPNALELHRWQINDARFVSQVVPSSIPPGGNAQVTVTMLNAGNTTWTSSSAYSLGSQGPQDNTTWGSNRQSLPASVQSGEQVSFTFSIPAPPFPSAVFQWQMVQDGVEWFGTLTPALTVAQAEPAECVALRANFAAHEQTIQQLEASRAGLNPRDPIDREEIRQIGKEIEQERRKVEELKQQASQLGCHIP